MVASTLTDYLQRNYTIYICSDSVKQTDRLRDIFAERKDQISFKAVDHTLHEGFIDHTLKMCLFTDHQIFDRFHKFNLRSDKARSGKVALSLKELNQFEPGDYVVHIDHGIGKFAGLVRIPNGNTTQEVIKLIYQNDDVVLFPSTPYIKFPSIKERKANSPVSANWEREPGKNERPYQG